MSGDVCQVAPESYTLISTALLSELLGVDQAASSTPPLPPLRNRYFGLRHGQSEANVAGVISSDPEVGTTTHGLTSEGRLQARRAATILLDLTGRDNTDQLYFYASDFTRAHQTADEALAGVINVLEYENAVPRGDRLELPELPQSLERGVERTPLLRERFFGDFDATELANYKKVWPRDLVSASQTDFGVESVEAVAGRIRQLLLELEEQHQGDTIVLTSHADTLQIAQCYIAGADCRTFCQYRFKNGEVRELAQDEATLPSPMPLSYL